MADVDDVDDGIQKIDNDSIADEVSDRRDDVCWSGRGCSRWLHRSDQRHFSIIFIIKLDNKCRLRWCLQEHEPGR